MTIHKTGKPLKTKEKKSTQKREVCPKLNQPKQT